MSNDTLSKKSLSDENLPFTPKFQNFSYDR